MAGSGGKFHNMPILDLVVSPKPVLTTTAFIFYLVLLLFPGVTDCQLPSISNAMVVSIASPQGALPGQVDAIVECNIGYKLDGGAASANIKCIPNSLGWNPPSCSCTYPSTHFDLVMYFPYLEKSIADAIRENIRENTYPRANSFSSDLDGEPRIKIEKKRKTQRFTASLV